MGIAFSIGLCLTDGNFSPMSVRTCTFQDCVKSIKSRGLCSAHYERVRKYGDPSITLKMGPKPGRTGELSASWKGDAVGVGGQHQRVRAARGNPQSCSQCGTDDLSKYYHWAFNNTGSRNNVEDYQRMCAGCHRSYDDAFVPRGSRHGNSKLTEADIPEIFAMRRQGRLLREIASHFSISIGTLSAVLDRKTWKHVEGGGEGGDRVSRLCKRAKRYLPITGIDPSSVDWNFKINTSVIPTVAGRVVQILGATLSDMTVSGQYGQNTKIGADGESWKQAEFFVDKIRQIQAFQSRDSTTRGLMHVPAVFNYSPKNWRFNVYVKAVTDPQGGSVTHRQGRFSYDYSLTLFIVDVLSDDLHVIKGAQKAAVDSYMARISEGIGWHFSQYNGQVSTKPIGGLYGQDSFTEEQGGVTP